MAERFDNSSKLKNSKLYQYTVKKRVPPRFPKRNNDLYISNKSNFISQFQKCEKLLDNNENEIILHGLGAAIERTINLALRLKQKYMDICELDINTSSVPIRDDLEPINENYDYDTQIRQNSAIHIRVYRTNLST